MLIVDLAIGEASEDAPAAPTLAQEFARTGGLKGRRARAENLTPERRQEIAKKSGGKAVENN
jgi:hypothetical protein